MASKDTFTGGARTKPAESNSLHGGLKNRAPKWPDSSVGIKGGKSVSADATRTSTASTPKTLGPRVA